MSHYSSVQGFFRLHTDYWTRVLSPHPVAHGYVRVSPSDLGGNRARPLLKRGVFHQVDFMPHHGCPTHFKIVSGEHICMLSKQISSTMCPLVRQLGLNATCIYVGCANVNSSTPVTIYSESNDAWKVDV